MNPYLAGRHLIISLAIFYFSPSSIYAQSPEEIKAYQFNSYLISESIRNFKGGAKEGTEHLAKLDLALMINTDAAGWWQKGTFFIDIISDFGGMPSDLTGDVQGFSNITAEATTKILQLWYQHSFLDSKLNILTGLHDYNCSFYSLATAALFTHSSFGVGPEISQVGAPVFPTTSAAIVINYSTDTQYFLLGTYDGVPGGRDNTHGTHVRFDKSDGFFNAAEIGLNNNQTYKIGIGIWQHTAQTINPIDGSFQDNNHGVYLIAEKYITKNTRGFFQLGSAASNSNRLNRYFGAGITYSNLVRNKDTIGLALASTRNSTPYLHANSRLETTETAWELTYMTPLTPHFQLQTSLYYVDNPGMDPTYKNALAAGLRIIWQP
jgi:porin